ncbi:MAG TPA: molybdate ABC transporter substrate-binding protein [Actinomycetota bacterium]|nr:molybdate ABC transporter substrate-binding protein [Actinomycetota bacterium]
MNRLVTVAIALTLMISGCARIGAGGENEELVVFAAASLTDSFQEIGSAFVEQYRDVTVTFNFGPSDGLATQIVSEGVADVFASASPRWMDAVANDGPGIIERRDFARNRLVVIVPAGNPVTVSDINDLGRPGVKLVLAAEDVPAGTYAREALAKAGIVAEAERNVVSNEQDVKGVVQKIVLGEADAGIVYVTDVTPAIRNRVETVAIPGTLNVIATYTIAVIRGTEHLALARAFVAFVLGRGQRVLERHGFATGP